MAVARDALSRSYGALCDVLVSILVSIEILSVATGNHVYDITDYNYTNEDNPYTYIHIYYVYVFEFVCPLISALSQHEHHAAHDIDTMLRRCLWFQQQRQSEFALKSRDNALLVLARVRESEVKVG